MTKDRGAVVGYGWMSRTIDDKNIEMPHYP